MALWRARANVPEFPSPDVTKALCAAEFGESFDLARLPPQTLKDLFAAVPQLAVSVPFAMVRLLARLATDARVDVRMEAAKNLAQFVEIYPERVEELLLLASCDPSRKVRAAAAETLAALLPRIPDPWRLIETWENEHPDRAREALRSARRSLPPPFGI
jgi:HEAT repeats